MRRSSLSRKTGLRAKAPIKRGTPKTQRYVDTGPDDDTKELVKQRANYGCERCGLARGQVIHHRDPRGAGGSSRPEVNAASNLVWICNPCHERVESRRLEAIGDGFLISDGFDSLTFPVRLHYGLVRLDDAGGCKRLGSDMHTAGCAIWTSDDHCDCEATT
jgi:hypothetical protein